MSDIVDPMPAPEPGENRMKAKDLKNQALILRPTEHSTEPGNDGKPWEFVECDVWVLDRQGVVAEGEGVRFSWWRAVVQLAQQMGELVACRPVEQDDRSVMLVPLSGPAREVATKVAVQISEGAPVDDAGEPF